MRKKYITQCPYCKYDGMYKREVGEPTIKGQFYRFKSHNVTNEPMRRGESCQEDKSGLQGCPNCGGVFLQWIDLRAK